VTTEERRRKGREAAKRWRKNNPERAKELGRLSSARYRDRHHQRDLDNKRKSDHKRRYGISLDDKAGLLAAQGFSCAICGSETPGGHGEWHTDHIHGTKIVRGILCHHCNVGLGHFRDNPAFLSSAINYLRINHGDTLCN
jgi:hypothetical protein